MHCAAYKHFVEGTRVAEAEGTWKIALSEMAKYPGEVKIAYQYLASIAASATF